MRPFAISTPALALLLTTGCVRIATTPFDPRTTWSRVPADSVRVFATTAPAQYTEVAVLRSRRILVASDARVLRLLREQAGKAGANGLLLLNTRGAVATSGGITGVILGRRPGLFSGQIDNDVDEFRRAVAIRFVPDPPSGQ